jgi:hypothetical protein
MIFLVFTLVLLYHTLNVFVLYSIFHFILKKYSSWTKNIGRIFLLGIDVLIIGFVFPILLFSSGNVKMLDNIIARNPTEKQVIHLTLRHEENQPFSKELGQINIGYIPFFVSETTSNCRESLSVDGKNYNIEVVSFTFFLIPTQFDIARCDGGYHDIQPFNFSRIYRE